VIADNCTDDTAPIALAAGADVVERHDPGKRGKGYALDFGIRHLALDPPEIVIVIDADCRVKGNTIQQLAMVCACRRRPVQALDLMTAPDAAPINYQIAEFAWRVKNWLRPLGIKLSTDELIQKLQENAQQVISSATNVAGTVFGIASSLIGGLFRWATIALFTFYFVADGPRFRRALLSRMRPDRQERVLFVWEQAIRQTGGYFYSRLLLAVINGTGMYVTLRLTNVPFAAPLAIFEGIVAEFIPIVGTYIGGAVPILVAFLASTAGLASPAAGFWALGYVLVYQQIENYLLSPRITAKTMSLHPAVAFAAALIGGALGGLFMAFLALPVAGVIQASVREWSKSYDLIRDDLTPQMAAPKRPGLMERFRRSRNMSGDDSD
jgi:predicted PurR-regulated permease PerM